MEVNEEEEAMDGLFLEDLILDLKSQARDAASREKDLGFIKLQALASVIKGSYNLVKDKSKSELRQIIYNDIESSPMKYYDKTTEKAELFNDDIVIRFLALQAIGREVVKVSADQRSIKWGDTDTLITEVPAGRKATDYLAEYLQTEDGGLVSKKLQELL